MASEVASKVSDIVTRLSTIIRQEYEFLGELRGELHSIKDEFQQMMMFLQGADLVVPYRPGTSSVAQILDVVHDVEHVLDELAIDCTNHRATIWYGAFHEMYTKSVRAITARQDFANQIKEIKKQVRDIVESHMRYVTESLSLRYNDLPPHLRICFLYMSNFTEDIPIDTEFLTQLWIVEGFVERIHGMTLEEVAESYLIALVDQCLVQVDVIGNNGNITKVRVHDIIRHIIFLKSSENNITTVFFARETMSSGNNVRRFPVQSSICDISEHAQGYFKSMRALFEYAKVGDDHLPVPFLSESFLFHLSSYSQKLLEVLDLKGASLEIFPDEILKLFHLKYLSLENTNLKFVPKSIEMLKNLQVLNLIGTHVRKLPIEIQTLQHLLFLIIGSCNEQGLFPRFDDVQGLKASFRIDELKNLERLYFIDADQVDNIRVVTMIGKLIHLRVLGITKLKREDGNELCSSLEKLRELRGLFVFSVNEDEFIDFQYFKSYCLPHLRVLTLAGRLEKCPETISFLNGLTTVGLLYSKLNDDPLKCLHDLPNLATLNLTAAYQGKSLCFKAGKFSKLKILEVCLLQKLRWVMVEENALASLQFFCLSVCQSMEDIPTGIEHLVRLQELEFSNMSDEFVNKLESLDNASPAYRMLLQIPLVMIGTYTEGEVMKVRRFNKESRTFN